MNQAIANADVRPSVHAKNRATPAPTLPQTDDTGIYKFLGDNGFHREVKRRAQEYFDQTGVKSRDNPSMYLKSLVLLLWFGASYGLLVFSAATWREGVLLMASLALAVGGISFSIQHDAGHGAYSKRRAVNRLMAFTLDIMGASSYIWRWKHNRAHHTFTGLDGADSDIDVPFGRLSPSQPYRKAYRFQQYYLWALYGIFVMHWHLFEDFKQLADGRIAQNRFPRPRGWRLAEMIAGKILFSCWAFVIPMLFHPWWLVLACYAATSVALSVILVLVFQLAHSVTEAALPALPTGCREVPRGWAVHQVEATVNFAPANRLLGWYVGGLNFQIEHHLFPRVCHVHYPQLAGIVKTACDEFNVRYSVNESLLGAVASHWRWLHRLGCEPTHQD